MTDEMPEQMQHFESIDHAYNAGLVVGRLLEAGFMAELVTDDRGRPTDVIEIIVASVPYHPTRVLLRVLPPSSDD
jgi:hypothetical protein